jgi:hypothetical protein
MAETAETIARAIDALSKKPKPKNKFSVSEGHYYGERVIFNTDDEDEAIRVADHPARRVIRNK